MDDRFPAGNVLGVNGLGRIGKLTVWYHLLRGHFQGFVVNLGRDVGTSLEDVLDLLATDSTYGPVEQFLLGVSAERRLRVVSHADGLLEVLGVPIRILRDSRDPAQLDWRRFGVRTVVDTTGVFLDPADESPSGSLRGHLASGAGVVIASAPFKTQLGKPLPRDSAMLIYGINHRSFEPHRHRVVSAASCTTTALAHMLLPLLQADPPANILTASLSTIHAATSTQSVLDSVPSEGAKDLRRNRATFDNLLVSTTGAAQALEHVLPAISSVGFLADSVRIPTRTVSLINLNLTLQAEVDGDGHPRFSVARSTSSIAPRRKAPSGACSSCPIARTCRRTSAGTMRRWSSRGQRRTPGSGTSRSPPPRFGPRGLTRRARFACRSPTRRSSAGTTTSTAATSTASVS